MHKLVIEREQWLRGDAPSEKVGNVLWSNEFNAGCCLGHFCMKIAEVDKEKLIEITIPADVKEPIVDLTDENCSQTKLTLTAMEINDSTRFKDDEREARLIELFGRNGYNLEFTGEGDPYAQFRKR